MFLVSDGAAAAKKKKVSSPFALAPSRCSLTSGSLEAGLASFNRTLQAHPFNQKIVILISFEDTSDPEEATFSPEALAEVEREERDRSKGARQPPPPSSSPASPPSSSPSSSPPSSSPSSSASSFAASSVCEARDRVAHHLVNLVQSCSTGVFFHGVSLASFLSLPLQTLLFSQHDACLLSWSGASPLCSSLAFASDSPEKGEERDQERDQGGAFLSSDLFLSDVATGGNAAALTADGGGTLLMRSCLYSDLYCSAAVALHSCTSFASFLPQLHAAFPATTRFLRVPLAHPAVLRHQTPSQSTAASPSLQRGKKFSGRGDSGAETGNHARATAQPSKMFLHLQHCLDKLAPLAFLGALKMPLRSAPESAVSEASALRSSLESLLGGSKSEARFVALTGITAQHRRYLCAAEKSDVVGSEAKQRGEQDRGFLALEAESRGENDDGCVGETRRAGNLPPERRKGTQENLEVWLPNWNDLLARVRQSAEKEGGKKSGSRQTIQRNAGHARGDTKLGRGRGSCETGSPLDVSMGEETGKEEEIEETEEIDEEIDEEMGEEKFPFPRLKPRLESAAVRLATSEYEEEKRAKRDGMQRKETERENLADEILQVLGSCGLDLPLNPSNENPDSLPQDGGSRRRPPFSWLEADDTGVRASRVSVLTIEGGIIHSSAIAAVVQCLSGALHLNPVDKNIQDLHRCLRRKRMALQAREKAGNGESEGEPETKSSSSSFSSSSPWFAVSTFGVPDAPTLFNGLPHGAVDLSGDSSCHFVGFLSANDNVAHAINLRSISAVDAAVALP
ncbi:conserved hypothetical protein [Neospora caninum Liverpool]|uniref:Uncharacterized protein n=1 Tax=Neospora caninum (strain Liverpool) TaxID=572307 RepID=F0VFI9_NEOCL|nr:conserved hypothetical protein [Neospora caninum Liverpool]CBZ52483.1 conserved hypothetical protein [Neospora caninum Liverpool]|eukprot:XP_003882515.1 conserved hypothetical protein [Neospora caninum Liverpool]